jgi:hypothetical protein
MRDCHAANSRCCKDDGLKVPEPTGIVDYVEARFAGSIHDIPTVAELIGRIVTEAAQLIRDRLMGFLEGRQR